MKKLLYVVMLGIAAGAAVSSCNDDDSWKEYEEWRNKNLAWYAEQQKRTNSDGTPFYTQLNPSWYPECGVLIHYFNDRTQTAGNLSPLLTSKVAVKYKGQLYNGVTFDSTSVATSDSVRVFSLSEVVAGWQIALMDMHVGDTCEVVLPFYVGYGETGSTAINPYSTLKFGIKLVDIPAYEIP